jgi:hypothetical protein
LVSVITIIAGEKKPTPREGVFVSGRLIKILTCWTPSWPDGGLNAAKGQHPADVDPRPLLKILQPSPLHSSDISRSVVGLVVDFNKFSTMGARVWDGIRFFASSGSATPIILFADFFSFLLANLIPFDIYAASLIQFVS